MSKSTVGAAVLAGAVATALRLWRPPRHDKSRSRRGHSRRQAEMLWRRLKGRMTALRAGHTCQGTSTVDFQETPGSSCRAALHHNRGARGRHGSRNQFESRPTIIGRAAPGEGR